jgi:pimeloyl-ACP methyl ester carboxylesterase
MSRTLTTPAGRLAYTREGTGPPVLLIQGAGVVGNGWRPQIDSLSGRFDLIAFDNRGIGGSELRGRLTVEGMARDALAVMDAEGIDRFHVAGHSLGGLIAQELALAAPSRVRSLALLCTFAHGRQGAVMSWGMLATALRMRIGSRAMRRRAFLELVMPAGYLASVNHAALAEQLRPLFGRDLADSPNITFKQVAAMARYDAFARLPDLPRVPTLVVSAAHDRIARPAFGRELAAGITGARFVEIADAGHGVTIQCAEQINDLLIHHLLAAEAQVGAA